MAPTLKVSALITPWIQGASQSLSAPHRRVRGDKPVAIAIENACLFFDGLAGGLVYRGFFDVPESRSSGPAQGQRPRTAKHCVDEIMWTSLPAKYSSVSPVPLRIATVCAGQGRFREFWMWR